MYRSGPDGGPDAKKGTMYIWHCTKDAPRVPNRVSAGERIRLSIGTWPVESGQSVWVLFRAERDGRKDGGRVEAVWQRNENGNSYWEAVIGPFENKTSLTYGVYGNCDQGEVQGPNCSLRVGAKIYLAILWHQHQPLYKDLLCSDPKGSYAQPWVRLHAIRDYYAMANAVARYPGVHLTINLTPCLLWQIEDYAERGATDHALDLTLKPSEKLTSEERERILSCFFDAHWHNQIFLYPRYKKLFEKRHAREPFSNQDIRDLQMWFNLVWFAAEFRESEVPLVTGETVSVRRWIEQGRDFGIDDIHEVVEAQYKIMRAVIPIHRQLQEAGQIEVSTTPYYHPILPLLVDTDRATIDRPGATRSPRFAQPDDAAAQIGTAVTSYRRWFGRPPRGMWPAEGAVAQFVIPLFAQHGVQWIATDRDVLARSGKYGYRTDDPNVLCQPYRVEEEGAALSAFFRSTELADAIGFHYHSWPDSEAAAADLMVRIKSEFAARFSGNEDRIMTIALDGENAWGDYPRDGRRFLHALYGLLETDPAVQTVTFSEYLNGDSSRSVSSHQVREQTKVYDLFAGSWADEPGSAPGVDLGTWIGDEEENRAWQLLAEARHAVAESGKSSQEAPEAYRSLYAAEGSDWYWWFGSDQYSGRDDEFDDLFRMHLKNVYGGLRLEVPASLDQHIVPHSVTWTFANQIAKVQPGDRVTVQTNCPGNLSWSVDADKPGNASLMPVGGVMAGVHRYNLTLGPFLSAQKRLTFTFQCTHQNCDCGDICCERQPFMIEISW